MTLTLPGGTADALRDAVYLDALASGRRITQGDAIAALVRLYSRRVARRVAAAGIDPAEALRLRDVAAANRGGPRVREARKLGVTFAGAVRMRY